MKSEIWANKKGNPAVLGFPYEKAIFERFSLGSCGEALQGFG